MNSKKKKQTTAKPEPAPAIAAEVPGAYNLPASPLTWFNKPAKNYVKRALILMGLASIAPFNAVENESDFIYCIREGVPKKALDNLIHVTGISNTDMSQIIGTSDRTLRRYTSKQKLNPGQSERVIELAKVYSRGEEVFGSMESFKEWMNSTVLALGNKKPKEFLDTSLGIDMLMDELGRIEHGIFA